MPSEIVPLRDCLRAAVPVAMKSRDRRAVSALRSALAAVENAEAVEIDADAPRAGAIEASRVGVGAAEAARRELTEADVMAIVQTEISERRAAATTYEASGHAERAAELLAEADVLAAHLS